jgi:hypothetical protein
MAVLIAYSGWPRRNRKILENKRPIVANLSPPFMPRSGIESQKTIAAGLRSPNFKIISTAGNNFGRALKFPKIITCAAGTLAEY